MLSKKLQRLLEFLANTRKWYFICNVLFALPVDEFHEILADGFRIGLAKDGRTYHEHVCSGIFTSEDVVELYAAIDLDIHFRLHLAEVADFIQAVRDEALATEAWVHAHDKNHVHDVEHVLDAFERRCRVDGDSRLHAEFCDLVQQAVQVVRRFGMDADDGGACLCKFTDVLFRVLDHQVAIQRKVRALLDAGGNARAETDVRDKVPVHDVQMDEACAAVFNGLEAVTEFEEVCVQDAWCDDLL